MTKVDSKASDDTVSLVLSPEQRREFLGRLAEFELKLAALTEMQANFVLAFLADPTSYKRAAERAGFKHPSIAANRVSRIPAVAATIALGEQLREDRTMITTDRTLHEFAIIAYSDIGDFEPTPSGGLGVREGVPAYMTRAVSSCEWTVDSYQDDEGRTHTKTKTKIRLWSKIDALKMIAMYQKMFSGPDGSNFVNDQSNHFHVHQHNHNTWEVGGKRLTF